MRISTENNLSLPIGWTGRKGNIMFNILRVLLYVVMIVVAIIEVATSHLAKRFDDERWNVFLPFIALFVVWKLIGLNFQYMRIMAHYSLTVMSLIEDIERDSQSYFKRGGDKKKKD